MLREIIVKTLVGKGKCQKIDEHRLVLTENISKTLGCWIINHQYETTYNDKHIAIKGSYDIQLWYAVDEDKKTNVFNKTVDFENDFVMSWKNIKQISEEMFSKIYVVKYPSPISMELENNNEVVLKIESTYIIECFKDAVITVECKDDESDDSDIIEDMIMNVNPNYIENKK